MRKLYISLLLLLSMHASAQCRLSSPDGLNEVIVSQKSDEFVNSVSHGGKAIVSDSRLGLDLDNYTWERALVRNYPQYDCWMNGFSVDSVTTTMNRSVITNLWGEQAVVPDNYNSATLPEADCTNLCIDLIQQGQACIDSWAARPLDRYMVHAQDMEYTFRIIPIIN